MQEAPCLPLSDENITRAADLLRGGGLVAFPTETVYGLGGDACNASAVANIFTAKGRPAFNPLISHVVSASEAFALGIETPAARRLADAFWPGPMTLILQRAPNCPIASLTSAGLDRIALRVPAHEGARRLLQQFEGPVAAPSANQSGRISPSRAAHVMAGLGEAIDMVLDGGPCSSGVESTVVDTSGTQAVILRPGGVTRDAITRCLAADGLSLMTGTQDGPSKDRPVSPGQLESHYAPHARLKMNVIAIEDDMELIGFGPIAGAGRLQLTLSESGNDSEAATNLFDMLHAADDTGASVIGVAPVPNNRLGEAINDRLRRAAVPRG
ncbi:MAG: threonylcarbamoyl-AMP synthase [Rhodospirillaceae bacterium]|nr:threonylcarbamoyl-AMP synthase [Rhodospirillaceae bacterium]